jgi:hypothetical protein
MHLTALRVVNLVAFVPSIVIATLALHVVGQGLVGVEAQLIGWFKSAVFWTTYALTSILLGGFVRAESAVDMKPCDRSSMHQPSRAACIEAGRACSRQSEHPNASDLIQSISFRPRAPRQDLAARRTWRHFRLLIGGHIG